MRYYHVYIEFYTSQGDVTSILWRNKSDVLVAERIVKPFHENSSFLCEGRVIKTSDVHRILIFKSEKRYQELFIPSVGSVVGWESLVGLEKTINYFLRGEIEGVEDVTELFIFHPPQDKGVPKKGITEPTVKTKPFSKDVFIVHGHNFELVKELRDMLLDFGLNPLILHEQASGSLTLAEKLEKYSDVGYAFVILTPDDVGGTEADFLNAVRALERLDLEDIYEDYMYHRARQNVVLEFGYFIGKLGRERVCCLYKGDIELPSDMQGIVYVSFNDSIYEQRPMIINELNEAGYEIQLKASIDSAQVLEINKVKMEVINRNLKVSFDIRNISESNILSLSVFGIIFDKNDTKASAESTESIGKLPKGKRMPIIQQFSNYDSNFETLTILVKNDEEILTQEFKISEHLKI